MSSKTVKVANLKDDFDVDALDHVAWDSATEASVENYWSGDEAPVGRHFTAQLLWSESALYVRFEANQTEPLIVSDKPDLSKKTEGLWDRDVCEIFIAPDKKERSRYFEFEIAPTGEWIDLAIDATSGKRMTDCDYSSGMESAARIEDHKIVMAIKIGWSGLRKTPTAGDVWLGNIFRCVGKNPTRGYLSWQATKTKTPNFHVPSKFGEFEFGK